MSKESAGRKGGNRRAEILPPSRRSEIAREAAMKRWSDEGKAVPLFAKYGAIDRPLRIGEIEIPCYVLADGTRVLAQRGLQSGIGLSQGGGKTGARRIAELMAGLAEKDIDVRGLIARANSPIRFIPPHGGNPADGYEATILPDICAVLIDAGQKGVLGKARTHLAVRAAQLQHGFATVGIIALVDEATGYQDFRQRDALAKILERFVAKELRPWVRTFPSDFYKQIYRLNNWPYSENAGRPGVIGHWTNNIVYKRLAPGVWEELKRLTPRLPGGDYKNKLFQRLTEDIGHPKLREHLAAVLMLMKYSPDWHVFMDRLDKEFPQWGSNYMLPFPDDYKPPETGEAAN
ncbi:MAG: P63C domain-containing protein [Bradyrhizobium sp.]|uniref:P63C domain-containing protein n=1 Tax=Bradyrhizobium sp. TaxID=376 RepID=UPI0025C5D602|nr:P63C domain-containing protein [Bradyrhizobium sp.]MBI5262181.1 P63C domain-containing protein [Bradyrhizobium sp.]